MRISHLCLSNYYVDGYLYQENELTRQHVRDGHEVLVVASTFIFSPDGRQMDARPGDYPGSDGARVIRLGYRWGLPAFVGRRLRIHVGVYAILAEFRPDVIMFHGCCGWELRTVARYVRDHPSVTLYVDSHADRYNSARTFASREILHKIYYRNILQSVLPCVKKLLCVSTEVKEFAASIYGVPESLLELYPLGGRPVPDDEYRVRRDRGRQRQGIAEGQILIVLSGKQTRRKKLVETLAALREVPDAGLRLVIAGTLHSDIRREAEALIEADGRVVLAGWQTPEDLTDLLCAADVYLQPGAQSVTMQHSLCYRCPVILADVPAHRVYLRGNGWLIGRDFGLAAILSRIRDADLAEMAGLSYRLACEMLDYRILSRRVLD